MSKKKKVIVYGLGKAYKQCKNIIKSRFDVIGYCDTYNTPNKRGGGIEIDEIVDYEYDYILITSSKYFNEIKQQLIHILGEDKSNKIISIYDSIGDFRNSEKRDEWVIKQLGEIPYGKILLDAGAGQQKYKTFCSHLKYIAQDFGKYVPNEIDLGLQLDSWDYTGMNIVCDIIDIPLDNNSVDVVLCTEVFEHLKNPILALKEFSRVIKPGGKLILTAPFCCLTHMAPYFYYNGFSEYWYKEHLLKYGFEIKEFTKYGNYFQYICQELLRTESMAERYCDIELNQEEADSIVKCMELMMRLSERDQGSDGTLRFGSMLVAELLEKGKI